MAVVITVDELRSALRLGTTAEETTEVTRLLAYATEAVNRNTPSAPDAIHGEAVIRLAAWLLDAPTSSANVSHADALRSSGAAAILLPWRIHRAGSTAEAVEAVQQAVGSTNNPVTGIGINGTVMTVTFADGTTTNLELPAGTGGGGGGDPVDPPTPGDDPPIVPTWRNGVEYLPRSLVYRSNAIWMARRTNNGVDPAFVNLTDWRFVSGDVFMAGALQAGTYYVNGAIGSEGGAWYIHVGGGSLTLPSTQPAHWERLGGAGFEQSKVDARINALVKTFALVGLRGIQLGDLDSSLSSLLVPDGTGIPVGHVVTKTGAGALSFGWAEPSGGGGGGGGGSTDVKGALIATLAVPAGVDDSPDSIGPWGVADTAPGGVTTPGSDGSQLRMLRTRPSNNVFGLIVQAKVGGTVVDELVLSWGPGYLSSVTTSVGYARLNMSGAHVEFRYQDSGSANHQFGVWTVNQEDYPADLTIEVYLALIG